MKTQPPVSSNAVWHYATATRQLIRPERVRAGQIADLTGISSPCEAPENPELTVNTGAEELEACVEQVLSAMVNRGIIEGT
jgi:hypothetical protein